MKTGHLNDILFFSPESLLSCPLQKLDAEGEEKVSAVLIYSTGTTSTI
jgi:hypothetical protein